MTISGESLTEHLPPLPRYQRPAGAHDGAVVCMTCGVWPAPRYVEDRQRLCEDCYRKRSAPAEDSSGSP